MIAARTGGKEVARQLDLKVAMMRLASRFALPDSSLAAAHVK